MQGLVYRIAIVFDSSETQNRLTFEYFLPYFDSFGLSVA